MAQPPASPESTWSYTPLKIERLHQHDLSYSSIQCDTLCQDIDPSAVPNGLEASLESLGVDLPTNIKEMIMENDVARLHTEHLIPSRAPFGPSTTVQLPTFVVNHQPNSNCYSYSTSSLALHQGTTDTKVRSEAQFSTVDRSLNSEQEHSFQFSAVEPTAINWGYDLEGIGSQFSDSEYEQQVFCHR
jgi:hypothetical protein